MPRPVTIYFAADQRQLFAVTLFGARSATRVLYVRAQTTLEAEALLIQLAPGATNVLIEEPTHIPPARVGVLNDVLYLSPLEEHR